MSIEPESPAFSAVENELDVISLGRKLSVMRSAGPPSDPVIEIDPASPGPEVDAWMKPPLTVRSSIASSIEPPAPSTVEASILGMPT
jgi:hypothetical protein